MLNGTKIFLVGGQNKKGPLTCIETLDLATGSAWEKFDAGSVLTPRDFTALCPIGPSSIAILGGEQRGSLTETLTLNTKLRRAKKMTMAE